MLDRRSIHFNLDTLNMCSSSSMYVYLSYASIWNYTMPHLIPGVHIYFTSKILRYIQYFAFLINQFYIWLLSEKTNEIIMN